MGRQSQLATTPNEPLRRVVLVPLDRISIIHGELMMEIMITFSDGDQGRNKMILGTVLVVEWRIPEIMRKRIDAEGAVVHETHPYRTRIYISSSPVSPPQPRDQRRHTKAHNYHQPNISSVLPPNNVVPVEVTDVGRTGPDAWLEYDPTNVSPDESSLNIVGVEVSVRVAMMRTMFS